MDVVLSLSEENNVSIVEEQEGSLLTLPISDVLKLYLSTVG